MLYRHNLAEYRRLYRKDSDTSVTPLVPSLNPEDYAYSHPAHPDVANVKEALDVLLSLTFEPPFAGENWQKFTADGEFIVPEGVTKVLALAIGAGGRGYCTGSTGNYTSFGGSGGTLVSAFLQTSPGTRYAVTIGVCTANSPDPYTSILDEGGVKILAPLQGGSYYYRDVAYTSNVLPDGVTIRNWAASGTNATSATGGRGGGGFAVAAGDDESERKAWLSVALNGFDPDSPGATTWMGVFCRPDSSQSAVKWSSARYGGPGAAYGGGGGGAGLGATMVQYRGPGGPGFVAFFW